MNILSKRPDGYHNIETCFYPVPWTDILELIPANEFSFACTGLNLPGHVEDNLCVKAYRMLQYDYKLDNAAIHLHKIIPTGAGLGGGSSDAAATLNLVNTVFVLGLSPDLLKKYASQLGSDCALFLENKPMIGKERGEELHKTELDLKGKFLIVIKPPVYVSTGDAYAQVLPKVPSVSITEIIERDISYWKDMLVNDFEESVFKKHPEIGAIKNKLYELGAAYASMSGSGSSVFGIFKYETDLRQEFPGTTYWSGYLSS